MVRGGGRTETLRGNRLGSAAKPRTVHELEEVRRTYHLLESEDREQWRALRRTAVLDVDADGVRWLVDPDTL